MKLNSLITPVYVKTDKNMEWPTDKVFYLVASEGLFLCRNHQFFRSCVKMKGGPRELESQAETVCLNYPTIPKTLVERAVGFFRLVAEKQNSEAAALFIWNRDTEQVELLVPEQKAINSSSSTSSPHGYPQDVKYEQPALPPHLVYMGDIHSHVDGGAYASGTDEFDEIHRPGIHIVVGQIHDKHPQFYCDAVVDGNRFSVDNLSTVWEGFSQADTESVPPEWVERVKLEKAKPWSYTSSYSYHDSTGYGYHPEIGESKKKQDKSVINKILVGFLSKDRCPSADEVRHKLVMETSVHTPYSYCEKRAKDFVNAWPKAKANHEKLLSKE